MIVEEMMNQDVITLNPSATIADAINLIRTHNIRHIPIVNHDFTIAGIVSDRDIRDASPSIFQPSDLANDLHKPVADLMTRNVITAHPLDFVEEIAGIFYEHNIGCVPIVKEHKLVGIVTEKDMLHTLIQLTGAHQPGSQIEVKVDDRPGILAELAALLKNSNINILSILVYPSPTINEKILVFRIQTLNPMMVVTKLKQNGYNVINWPQVPGASS
ncbi:acetoin utilization AcuB family protein [Priestia koreensis]|uniref:Acetoin utilization protein AcuB n=1 Tax=Priestia koreensis TaxID=284581 RepID=A0A0M0L7F4_9BACI|nr:acetoin utilization AcuB family protein [Priestia koreensis]KOO46812.1 acetoin utilization protein AcuB [Priestia koreensis]MCM3002825.1 acetoin utilization AcuB family protein [Priestia koreensis]